MIDETRSELARILQFNPQWLIGDPVPDPFIKQLNPAVIRELLVIQMELQKAVLTAHVQAIDKATKVLAR